MVCAWCEKRQDYRAFRSERAAHCDRLFAAGVPAIGTDPDPDNHRARRAYEKAGFAVASEPSTRFGAARS